jgi:hypothetical protein
MSQKNTTDPKIGCNQKLQNFFPITMKLGQNNLWTQELVVLTMQVSLQ